MREIGLALDGQTNVVAMQDVNIGCCQTAMALRVRAVRWGLTGAALALDASVTGALAALPATPPMVAVLLGVGNAAIGVLVVCAIGISQL